jgi:hypothetical protein
MQIVTDILTGSEFHLPFDDHEKMTATQTSSENANHRCDTNGQTYH